MKGQGSLSRRILTLAFINLALVLAVFLVFAHFQYHLEPGSFLFAPARDRLEGVAMEVALDLENTPAERRTELMARYAANYGVDFLLFDNTGEQLAGRPVTLPAEVVRVLRGPPGRAGDGKREDDTKGGPPPPRGDGPGPERRPPPPPPPGRMGGGQAPGRGGHQVFQLSAGENYWAGVRIPVNDPEREGARRGTLILAAKSFYNTPLFFDFKPWLMALAAVIAIFLTCWVPFIRGITKTLSHITNAAEQIGQGNFELQLPEAGNDELAHLSVAINRMATQLAGFVRGQKRFLGDIAHELCAPIARMQFGLGILEQQAQEGQQAAVEDVQEEMRQMSSLVGELLSFSKAGMEAGRRTLVPVNVAEVARQAAERESPDGKVVVEAAETLTSMADREFLLRALSNLVRNAVRYAGDEGPITIAARRENEDAVITVSDCGPGLPEEELERIFTPFYRLEASRNREHGGTGLGLAIVKSCVEGCRGRAKCRNRTPSGLEVEIRLAAS